MGGGQFGVPGNVTIPGEMGEYLGSGEYPPSSGDWGLYWGVGAGGGDVKSTNPIGGGTENSAGNGGGV